VTTFELDSVRKICWVVLFCSVGYFTTLYQLLSIYSTDWDGRMVYQEDCGFSCRPLKELYFRNWGKSRKFPIRI